MPLAALSGVLAAAAAWRRSPGTSFLSYLTFSKGHHTLVGLPSPAEHIMIQKGTQVESVFSQDTYIWR
jgi:hypothetical protein